MDEVTWDDVKQEEIDKELAYWLTQKAMVIWLTPCRYEDGSPTCMGHLPEPTWNPDRRMYIRVSTWRRA